MTHQKVFKESTVKCNTCPFFWQIIARSNKIQWTPKKEISPKEIRNISEMDKFSPAFLCLWVIIHSKNCPCFLKCPFEEDKFTFAFLKPIPFHQNHTQATPAHTDSEQKYSNNRLWPFALTMYSEYETSFSSQDVVRECPEWLNPPPSLCHYSASSIDYIIHFIFHTPKICPVTRGCKKWLL